MDHQQKRSQVGNGHVTRYAIALNLRQGVSPFEDSQGNLGGERSGAYRLRDGRITKFKEKDGVPPRQLMQPQCEDHQAVYRWWTSPLQGWTLYFY
jgi:hypothetical protein